MCGLFGAFGQPDAIDVQAIRHLATLNQDRGRDSTGFFTGEGASFKIAERAVEWLRSEKLRDFLWDSRRTGAICGHTRAGTRGPAITDNAHPFAYGNVVGSHNGVLWGAPLKYDVDSMYAFDLLSQNPPGQYQKALGDVDGSYVLTWYDSRDRGLYFLNWKGNLAFIKFNNVCYYSSDARHIEVVFGHKPTFDTACGSVFRWQKGKFKKLKQFSGGTQTKPAVFKGGYQGWDDEHPYYRPGQPYKSLKYTGHVSQLTEKFDDSQHWLAELQKGGWEPLSPRASKIVSTVAFFDKTPTPTRPGSSYLKYWIGGMRLQNIIENDERQKGVIPAPTNGTGTVVHTATPGVDDTKEVLPLSGQIICRKCQTSYVNEKECPGCGNESVIIIPEIVEDHTSPPPSNLVPLEMVTESQAYAQALADMSGGLIN